MQQYEVTFTVGDKRYNKTVGASSSNDAERLVKSEHPSASIVKTVKK